jgi:hypothetical protein
MNNKGFTSTKPLHSPLTRHRFPLSLCFLPANNYHYHLLTPVRKSSMIWVIIMLGSVWARVPLPCKMHSTIERFHINKRRNVFSLTWVGLHVFSKCFFVILQVISSLAIMLDLLVIRNLVAGQVEFFLPPPSSNAKSHGIKPCRGYLWNSLNFLLQ